MHSRTSNNPSSLFLSNFASPKTASPREICLPGRRIAYLVNIARRQGDRDMPQLFPPLLPLEKPPIM